MALTDADADTYFALDSHPRAHVWEKFSQEQKTGAIVHARRVLCRAIGTTLTETATADGDAPRHDLALYEQALWTLENSPYVSDGDQPSPGFLATDIEADDESRRRDPGTVSPEALRWLQIGSGKDNTGPAGMLEICRG